MYQFWKCAHCQFKNDVLTSTCKGCLKAEKPDYVTDKIQTITEIKRNILVARIAVAEDKKDLFVKFYNPAKISVSTLTDEKLAEHISQLEDILIEAKANLSAATDERRERVSKSRNKQFTISSDLNSSNAVTDAIEAVKTRQKRMSKLDKIKQQLEDIGIDQEEIERTVRRIQTKATEKQVEKVNFEAKPKKTTEVEFKSNPEEPKKPLDFGSLKFASKK